MDYDPHSKLDSPFRYVLVASQRAEQLMRGARPKGDAAAKRKPTVLAMDEVDHQMIDWDYGPPPEPEVEEAVIEEPEVF